MSELETAPLKVERVAEIAKPGEKITYSPFGYVIASDGTTYSLVYRWYHGVICACLFPEVAKAAGYEHPVTPHQYNDVFAYQRFELDNNSKMDVIRIAVSSMMAEMNFATSGKPATQAQIDAVLEIGKLHGLKARDQVIVSYGFEEFKDIVEALRKGDDLGGSDD